MQISQCLIIKSNGKPAGYHVPIFLQKQSPLTYYRTLSLDEGFNSFLAKRTSPEIPLLVVATKLRKKRAHNKTGVRMIIATTSPMRTRFAVSFFTWRRATSGGPRLSMKTISYIADGPNREEPVSRSGRQEGSDEGKKPPAEKMQSWEKGASYCRYHMGTWSLTGSDELPMDVYSCHVYEDSSRINVD